MAKTILTKQGLLIQKGFFLITFRKCINLQLWAETEDELFEYMSEDEIKKCKKAPYHVVPCYVDDNGKNYIVFNNTLYSL